MAEEADRDYVHKDDAATMAASEELKHTTISDKVNMTPENEAPVPKLEPPREDKDVEEQTKAGAAEGDSTEAKHEEMKESISSPKKKRGRDFEDDSKDVEGEDGSNGGALRSEPEKKRPRDTSEDLAKISTKAEVRFTLSHRTSRLLAMANQLRCRR
jgi:hypothetical protein